MFRNILAPLRTPSRVPVSKGQAGTVSPGNHSGESVRDVMRVHVDELRAQFDPQPRSHSLTAIHKLFLDESASKDAFREFDGFQSLILILASLELKDTDEIKELTRLVFLVLDESLSMHPRNQHHLKVSSIHSVLGV